jgi:hypothetical protein
MLYADMRPGKRNGFNKIQKALDSEASKYPKPALPPAMDDSSSWQRKRAYQKFLGDLSDGGWFFGTVDISATRSVDVEGFTIHDSDVHVDFVSDFGFSDRSISQSDFDDWSNSVAEDGSARFGLLISERPLSRNLATKLDVSDGVGVRVGVDLGQVDLLVVADLSTSRGEAERRDVLSRAYAFVAHAVAAEQSDAES